MTRNEAKTLWIAQFEANAKYLRNLRKAQFIAATPGRAADEFAAFEIVDRLNKKLAEATAIATNATLSIMKAADIPTLIAEAETEWHGA